MKKLIRILTVHSVQDLFKYKSFLFLIFFLMTADRLLHHFVEVERPSLALPQDGFLTNETAVYVFDLLPGQVAEWVFQWQTAAIAVMLFLLKQLISLWPSSDMRRMHRLERGKFGLWEALAVLRWRQVAWDAAAVGTLCTLTALWVLFAFGIGWLFWKTNPIPALLSFIGLGALSLPLVLAGFSYSSKLAVISQGQFYRRWGLFMQLFFNLHILWTSWLFFLARIILEMVFVAAIPAGAFLLIDNYFIRMIVATLSATPVYSFLKMASFKFFLETYARFPMVRNEYRDYFEKP